MKILHFVDDNRLVWNRPWRQLLGAVGEQMEGVEQVVVCRPGGTLEPSLEEGMGLTLMQAIKMGVPIFATDIPAVKELSLDGQNLITHGPSEDWMRAIAGFFDKGISMQKFDVAKISSLSRMVGAVEEYYNEIILRNTGFF